MVEIVYEPEYQRSCAYDDGKVVGECTYTAEDGIWTIDHTEVDETYKGKGVASKLVDEVVQQARDAEVKIIPRCPYAKKLFEHKKQYADVWAEH